jgi:inner membrane protein
MTAKGHVVLAITPLSVLYGMNTFLSPEILLPVLFGSLLPDIDEPGSYIGRKFYFISGIFRDLGLEHRGFTHFLIIPLSLMMISYVLFDGGWLFWLAFGIFMHDVGDMLTKGGIISFFYPLGIGKKIGLLPKTFRFRTFSLTEKIVILLLLLMNFVFLFKEFT